VAAASAVATASSLAAARAVHLMLLMLVGMSEGEILRAMRRLSVRLVVVVRIASVAALPLIPGSHDGAPGEKRLGEGEARGCCGEHPLRAAWVTSFRGSRMGCVLKVKTGESSRVECVGNGETNRRSVAMGAVAWIGNESSTVLRLKHSRLDGASVVCLAVALGLRAAASPVLFTFIHTRELCQGPCNSCNASDIFHVHTVSPKLWPGASREPNK
jgi:hypothetical protein